MITKISANARHRARRFALQALYQWQLSGNDLSWIQQQFDQDETMQKTDKEYFHELLYKVPSLIEQLDALFGEHLDRTVEQLDPVELAILRLSCYELAHRIDVPYKVVINEAVELAKKFGAEGSHRYINGILDKVAKQVRTTEMKQK